MKSQNLLYMILFVGCSCLAADFEAPPSLKIADVVPAQLQTGPNHKVVSIDNNGIRNRYLIDTGFGQFEAFGGVDLRVRIREADALTYLNEMSKTKVFLDAIKDAGIQTVKSIAVAFTQPVQTIKGLPAGVTRLFAGYARSTKRGIMETENIAKGSSAEGMAPEEFKRLNYLVGDAEREWALELKVDPYTTNMKLRSAISSMAMVQFIGGLPVDFALPMTASLTVSILGEIGEQIYQQDATKLEQANRACLQAVGIDSERINGFFDALYLSPTTHTVFCSVIKRMTDISNIAMLVDKLANTGSFEESRFLLGTVTLLAWYHNQQSSLESLVADDGVPYAITSTGDLVVIIPADYLSWTEIVAAGVNRLDEHAEKGGVKRKSIWLLGEASEKMREQLMARGWILQDRKSNGQLAKLYESSLISGNESFSD